MLKAGSGTQLLELFGPMTETIGETLSSLVGKQIHVQTGELLLQDVATLLATLPRACAIARGGLDKDYAGKSLCTLFELPDAIAMSGLLMMTPEDVIGQRRKAGVLEGEDSEAFGELGNVLYSGFSNVLRRQVSNADIRMQDQGVVKPKSAACDLLGDGKIVTFGFRMKVGEFPESQGMLVLDQATAEAWNGAPLATASGQEVVAAAPAAPGRPEDDGLDSIPAAPIRGSLAAFVLQNDVFQTLRRSCRRVGLELHRHGRGEIPNPAAHRNQIVVLEVPPGEDRRFDWCRRIKELSETTPVVLLIRHPSRPRVTQAFLSKADAILGFPCEETQLSQKLGQIVPDGSATPPPSEG
ncbi:MAG: hypothetical protein H6835_08805 [Planctomycetes bacterium]|nr:hypothetical protein [Planctomycetota bacterium]